MLVVPVCPPPPFIPYTPLLCSVPQDTNLWIGLTWAPLPRAQPVRSTRDQRAGREEFPGIYPCSVLLLDHTSALASFLQAPDLLGLLDHDFLLLPLQPQPLSIPTPWFP